MDKGGAADAGREAKSKLGHITQCVLSACSFCKMIGTPRSYLIIFGIFASHAKQNHIPRLPNLKLFCTGNIQTKDLGLAIRQRISYYRSLNPILLSDLGYSKSQYYELFSQMRHKSAQHRSQLQMFISHLKRSTLAMCDFTF